jgi:hypothetical protein
MIYELWFASSMTFTNNGHLIENADLLHTHDPN